MSLEKRRKALEDEWIRKEEEKFKRLYCDCESIRKCKSDETDKRCKKWRKNERNTD